jgi:hypothetical protein
LSSHLVLDEQLQGRSLVLGLRARGIAVTTVNELGLQGRIDPELVSRIAERVDPPWVLVTMDLTIVEDHPNFKWDDYAIAWVIVPADLRGPEVEAHKADIVHHHVRKIGEQGRGSHMTYYKTRHTSGPPSLDRQLRGPGGR